MVGNGRSPNGLGTKQQTISYIFISVPVNTKLLSPVLFSIETYFGTYPKTDIWKIGFKISKWKGQRMKIDGYNNREVPIRPVHFVLAPRTNKRCKAHSNEKKSFFHAPNFFQNYVWNHGQSEEYQQFSGEV